MLQAHDICRIIKSPNSVELGACALTRKNLGRCFFRFQKLLGFFNPRPKETSLESTVEHCSSPVFTGDLFFEVIDEGVQKSFGIRFLGGTLHLTVSATLADGSDDLTELLFH